MEEKKALRNRIIKLLRSQPEQQRKEGSQRVADILFSLPEWNEAHAIGITISLPHEVQTELIISRGWEEGKQIAVPRVKKGTTQMTFYEIHSFSVLEDTFFGLREPKPSECRQIDGQELDLLLVPGVAFDQKGNRLGYGGGYYDRFLHSYKGKTIALAYSQQLVESVPTDERDERVQMIVTERGVYR